MKHLSSLMFDILHHNCQHHHHEHHPHPLLPPPRPPPRPPPPRPPPSPPHHHHLCQVSSIGLPRRRSRIQTPSGPTLRVLK